MTNRSTPLTGTDRAGQAMLALPLVILVGVVLVIFADFPAPPGDLWRPLVLGVAVTLVAQAALGLVLRDRVLAAYLTTLVVAAALGLWILLGIAVVIPVWTDLVQENRRRRGRVPARINVRTWASVAGRIALVFLVISITRVALVVGPWNTAAPPGPMSLPGTGGPDIFVIMLDGYPRSDTLIDQFGIDTSDFLDALESNGFVIDPGARSNYMRTWLSIASLFHLSYVDAIPALAEPPMDRVEHYRMASRAIEQAPYAAALKERGYQIVATTSAFSDAALSSADVIIDAPAPTNFEHHLMQTTTLASVIDWVAPELLPSLQLHEVDDGLRSAATRAAASPSDDPVFMFIHVLAPHLPAVADAQGNVKPMAACYPSTCGFWDHLRPTLKMTDAEFVDYFEPYLMWVNDRVLETVSAIVRESPNAVVILMSDHGLRDDPNDVDEYFRTLFAARTPGKQNAFAPGISPANVFRELSNAYFSTDFDRLPYRSWVSQPGLLELTLWTDEAL